MTPTDFHDLMRAIRTKYHGSVTGGARTIKRNATVGGDPNSRHLLDLAEDVVLDEMAADGPSFQQECRRQGLICEHEYVGTEREHYHVQTR